MVVARDRLSVLIPDGESADAVSVLRCLGAVPGLRTSVLSQDLLAPIRFSRHHVQFRSQPGHESDEQRLAAIHQAAALTRADVVLPVGQPTIRLLSAHRDALPSGVAVAPLPDIEAFDIAANKWSLAQWLTGAGFRCPPTVLCQPGAESDRSLSAIPFPVLIKPTNKAYGEGIKRFESLSELLRFVREHPPSREFIVQSFVEGYDIDCSVLCQTGTILACTIQKGFMAGDHRFGAPGGVEFMHDDETYDVVARIVKALNWSGVAHIDLRRDERDGHVTVIEINPRFWGSVIGSLAAGVNFPYLACLAGLGLALPEMEYRHIRYVAGRAALRQIRRGSFSLGNIAGSSSLGFLLRDPLPELFGSCIQAYRKVIKRKR